MSFFDELKWRKMIQDNTPEFEEHVNTKKTVGYIGFDPTSDSLHIGSLVQLIILKHFQSHGHKPIVLIGGATGMIGDPSGKSKERNLLSQEEVDKNISSLKKQFSKFLDFDCGENSAIILNNYEWTKDLSIIEFFRDYGKALTVNYMMSKESVKKRISSENSDGMSFTEFTYQLFQAYDFYFLNTNHNCSIQMGGSDQWGNITSGVELTRKKSGIKVHALTCPLITKADGTKFGKTEEGNVWLDRDKTSPYKFYQYWLNTSDEDAIKYLKIFSFMNEASVIKMIEEHLASPHLRLIQKQLASELTKLVHSEEDLNNVIFASNIIFSKESKDNLSEIDEKTLLQIFDGLPVTKISLSDYQKSENIENVLMNSSLFNSFSDLRRALKENSVSVNRKKIDSESKISGIEIIKNKYIIVQRGKKKYSLLILD
ncbi:MAG: tyrosine--tRNA ligase [Flavobacteriaceae bacterium]|nr:MAG: tyrosine--tRNA ligase [Flavobacteriales bacterium]